MAGVNVKSEIKPLKKVLLHRPGKELLNLTPNTLEELLFDDIPFLKVAQEEHDAFAQALRDNGVEVVYLEDLTAEVLAADPELREKFLLQWIDEAGIKTERYRKIIFDYMQENYPDAKDFVLKTMEGTGLYLVKELPALAYLFFADVPISWPLAMLKLLGCALLGAAVFLPVHLGLGRLHAWEVIQAPLFRRGKW